MFHACMSAAVLTKLRVRFNTGPATTPLLPDASNWPPLILICNCLYIFYDKQNGSEPSQRLVAWAEFLCVTCFNLPQGIAQCNYLPLKLGEKGPFFITKVKIDGHAEGADTYC